MPELPEVETVRKSLADRLQGRAVVAVEVIHPVLVRYPAAEDFARELAGACFAAISRRGKYLIFHLDGGRHLVCHLRMTGRLHLVSDPGATPRQPHTHVVFHLDDSSELRYLDLRTFGGFHLLGPRGEGTPAGLSSLGPEPFDPVFTPAYIGQALARHRRAPVKAVLLNQAFVAGIGNIYADEALFRARIHPARPAGSLSPGEIAGLHQAVTGVLAQAIDLRGTTFSSFMDGYGKSGGFYDHLQVFDREGRPCPACGGPVEKTRVAGRGTHLCPVCQPGPN